jgi:hypothetical protein
MGDYQRRAIFGYAVERIFNFAIGHWIAWLAEVKRLGAIIYREPSLQRPEAVMKAHTWIRPSALESVSKVMKHGRSDAQAA